MVIDGDVVSVTSTMEVNLAWNNRKAVGLEGVK